MNARLAMLLLAGVALLAGCQQETVREIDWAKAALSRNPAYEILATDETAGVFTVRDTATGSVSTLKLEDLIAAPRPPRAPAKPASVPEQPAMESPDAPEDAGDATLAHQTTETAESSGGGATLAEGPGYRIARGTGSEPEPAAQTTLEGPGYRIERQGPSPPAQRADSAAPAEEPVAANVLRRTDPIVCQGDRLMRIDGETLSFTGDAVIAEKGCDLYISNAHIRAGGVGIIARQARVHIVNSTIGGSRGSYEVSDGAEIYVARSTFTGVGRRFEGGSMTDLGGNSYLTQ